MKKVLFTILAVAAILCVSCKKDPKPSPTPGPNPDDGGGDEPTYVQPITIDGDFSDWAKLDASKVAVGKCDANALFNAVKEIRCYADELYVFYYIEFDNNQIGDLLAGTNNSADPDHNQLPIRLDINTDGEFESGYHKYFQESYDFIIEGGIATNGQWSSFDGDLLQRIEGSWTDPALLAGGSGLCSGAGNGNKYEICLIREVFNSAAGSSTVPMPMGDEFQTGITFYTAPWGELGGMPNGPVTEEDAKGWDHLMTVTTVH